MWAAEHRRRELWVGFPAVKAILATRIVPGLLDRLLARRAYAGQLTEKGLPPARPDNLYFPVPGDHGAHGRFGDRAKPSSWQFRLTTHRWTAATCLATTLVLLGWLGLAVLQ